MKEYSWFKSYDRGVPHSLKPYAKTGPIHLLSETVKLNPDHTMLIFEDRRFSWKEIDKGSDELAAALLAHGLKKGDRVAILFLNCPQTFLAFYAVWKAGGIVVPLNPLYTQHELERSLNDVGAEIAFVFTYWYQTLKSLQAKTKLRLIIATEADEYAIGENKSTTHNIALEKGDLWWSDLMSQYSGSNRPRIKVKPSDTAVILFSGGTTGTPKGVMCSHQSFSIAAKQVRAWVNDIGIMDEWKEVGLVPMPPFHNAGVYPSFSYYITFRSTQLLITDPRDLKGLLAAIRKYQVSFLLLSPTSYIALLNYSDRQPDDLKSVKWAASGTAPLMTDTRERVLLLIYKGGVMGEGYALTESCIAGTLSPAKGIWKQGSVGIPFPDVIIRIVDMDTGKIEMKTGQEGEILIKAPQLMKGYWNRPEETAESLRHGWLYTGDIGYLDDDGYLFITSRKKDLIKSSGFQVWPREVEDVLSGHPAVAEVCVAGIPDPYKGEAVKAWIVVKEGQEVTIEELNQYCRQTLVAYKVPKHYEFCKDLPKTIVGKVLRRVLQDKEKAKQSVK